MRCHILFWDLVAILLQHILFRLRGQRCPGNAQQTHQYLREGRSLCSCRCCWAAKTDSYADSRPAAGAHSRANAQPSANSDYRANTDADSRTNAETDSRANAEAHSRAYSFADPSAYFLADSSAYFLADSYADASLADSDARARSSGGSRDRAKLIPLAGCFGGLHSPGKREYVHHEPELSTEVQKHGSV